MLLLLNVLFFLGSFLTAFFSVIFKPIFFVFKKIFFKVFVKVYLGYFSFLRKIGWDKWSGNFFSYIFNKKTVHFLVFVLVLAVSLQSSLLRIGMAKALSDNINKTRFSKLITKELYEDSEDDLIEEYFADNVFTEQTRYMDDSNILSSNSGVGSNLENEDNFLASGEDILVKPDLSTTQLGKKTRKEAVEYIVQSGDTISTIAADFDISVNTILWENSLSSGSVIRPGDKLTILQDSGVSHKIVKGDTLIAIANKYGVDSGSILAANNLSDSTTLSVGQKLFIPGGKIQYSASKPKTTVAYNPISVIKDLISPSAKSTPANKMLWPAQGTITQYFTWRHHGLDIANKQGTPIYAAEAGTVEIAITGGWNSGYGNTVLIDHGNGKKTRYGHFYKVSVKKGEVVERGQLIGLMGTTGNSSGPHLHFEVRINNITYNPLDYIK